MFTVSDEVVRRNLLPVLLALLIYGARVADNPPGFYVDESSVAFNAHTIARSGHDEFGNSWPLFFRAFGDYKNPVYIYSLALLFKVFGTSIFVARMFSALAGVSTVALLTLLAVRISRRRSVGLFVGLTAVLTPWLFELSRVSLEVALFPFATALFLLVLHRAARKEQWSWTEVTTLALSLGLLSYTYSIGRLLGPLLALGLVLFIGSARWPRLVQTWLLYGVTLIPMLVFHHQNPGALVGRFKLVSYITTEAGLPEIVVEFMKHFVGSFNPHRLLVTGDPDLYQVVHVPGTPAILAPTFFLALFGIWQVLRQHGSDPWWRFALYGLVVSAVPASLTLEYFHMLRLSAMPVFLLLLTVPAFAWLSQKQERQRPFRLILASLVLLTILQGAHFQWEFYAAGKSPWRRHLFDADYQEKIFKRAIDSSSRPIYLTDEITTPYIQAYWYATLHGIPLSEFVILAPDQTIPAGALVISTEEVRPEIPVLAQVKPYTLYVSTDKPRVPAPLPDSSFRARIEVPNPPHTVRTNQTTTIQVIVRNESDVTWPARERLFGPYQVGLGNHWLDATGRTVTSEDGFTALRQDLNPGEERELPLTVRSPRASGEYLLQIDMVQKGVTWFGHKGSKTLRIPMRVE